MEAIQQYLSNNPMAYGFLIILLGLYLFFKVFFEKNGLFKKIDRANYNPGKMEGIIHHLRKKTVRIFFIVFCLLILLCGILVIWISLNKS